MVTRTIQIEAPIETVYRMITDLESYPQFLSTTKNVKTQKINGHLEADFRVSVIRDIEYRLRFELVEPTEVRWSFVSGQMMKKNSGCWRLKALGPSRTEAIYEVDVQFGWMVPKTVVDTLTEVQLPTLLDSFKKRAEELYGSRT